MPWSAPRRAAAVLACAASVAAALSAGAANPARRVGRQPDGSVVLPTNQEIRPAGTQVEFPGRPNAVAVRPGGQTAALLTDQAPAVTVVDLATGGVVQRFDPHAGDASFAGIAYDRAGTRLYASLSTGKVVEAAVAPDGTLTLVATIPLGSPPGGLALSGDGRLLYATLNHANALAAIDLATHRVVSRIAVGNAPHSVVLAGGYAVVSNRGGRRARPGDVTNDSAGTAIVSTRTSGSVKTGTVSVVDLRARRSVAEVQVGLEPAGMAVRGRYVFVANANSDTVSVLDVGSRRVVAVLSARPFAGAPFGSSPNAVAVLDAERVVVANARNNALAVIRWAGPGARPVTEGLLPTAWYPSDVVVQGGRIVVANAKGVGSLPADTGSGQPVVGVGAGGVGVKANRGSISVIGIPGPDALEAATTTVFANNHWDHRTPVRRGSADAPPRAVPHLIGEPSLIKHVFLVVKENRTYDQILGDVANGDGDPTKVQFGAAVTPNQHLLAAQFPLLDNFYVNGTVSADGHQWLTQAFVNDYVEEAFGDFSRSNPYDGGDALAYAPTPFLWEHAQRYGRSVRVYGEFADHYDRTGTRSDIPSLDKVLVRSYPRFDLRYPDAERYKVFAAELARQVATGSVPSLSIIQLPMDHTHGLSAGTTSPTVDVADNDVAFGKIVETISHSPVWGSSAIFAVEDDSQSGLDHVDGHRTTAFVVSPYAVRALVDHTYYTQIDMVRTIEQILGLPPMNQVDMLATPMRGVFTDYPTTAPYDAVDAHVSALRNPPLSALRGVPLLWAKACDAIDFTRPDAAPDALLNRAIWYAVRGWVPYPGDPRVLTPDEVLRSLS